MYPWFPLYRFLNTPLISSLEKKLDGVPPPAAPPHYTPAMELLVITRNIAQAMAEEFVQSCVYKRLLTIEPFSLFQTACSNGYCNTLIFARKPLAFKWF